MPRRSERAQVLKDIDAAIEIAACSYLFDGVEKEEEEEEEEEEHIQDFCAVQEVIGTPVRRLLETLSRRVFGRL